MEIILAIIGSGVLSVLVQGIFKLVERRQDKKGKLYQEIVAKLDQMNSKLDNNTEGLQLLLHDKIKCIAEQAIVDKKISFDNYNLLVRMHGVYHNKLGGNGYLDSLMKAVDALPKY